MLIARYGHAAVLVEAVGTRVLTDPGTFSTPQTFELTDLAAIVVTHQHPDHLDPERVGPLIEANPQAMLLADPETAHQSGSRWRAHTDGDVTTIGGLQITGVGTEHAVIAPQIPVIANVGVLIEAPGEPVMFHPGDSYASAPRADILALPLSAPWTKVSETIDFARRVAPQTLFPIHDATVSERGYGIYWNHVRNFAGVEGARLLGQDEQLEL